MFNILSELVVIMDKFYFGTHMNYYNNLVGAAKSVQNAGGNLIQIFLTRPNHRVDKSDLEPFTRYLKDNDMRVVVHSSYTHNIAQNWDQHSWWLKNLEIEIKYAHMIGAFGLVLHIGKQMELTREEAFNNMYTSLIYVHNRTKEYSDVKIFLETSAGQGTEMCYRLEELAKFYKKFSKNDNKDLKDRIKLCVDTCHVFVAGYNLKTETDVKLFLEAFDELIGISNIRLIHLNDSVVDVGCQKDRHDNIGVGYIGLEGLRYIFRYFRKLNVPIVLETPFNGYKKEIPLLSSS
jgi:deoxyribonuclease IV